MLRADVRGEPVQVQADPAGRPRVQRSELEVQGLALDGDGEDGYRRGLVHPLRSVPAVGLARERTEGDQAARFAAEPGDGQRAVERTAELAPAHRQCECGRGAGRGRGGSHRRPGTHPHPDRGEEDQDEES